MILESARAVKRGREFESVTPSGWVAWVHASSHSSRNAGSGAFSFSQFLGTVAAMLKRLATAALVVAPLAFGAPAHAADDCPASGQLDAILRAVETAPSCTTAYKIAEACAFGSTADVQTTSIVITKCEARMTAAQRAGYERAAKACAAKHAGKDGTMYRSMAAFCAAGAAVRAAGKAGR